MSRVSRNYRGGRPANHDGRACGYERMIWGEEAQQPPTKTSQYPAELRCWCRSGGFKKLRLSLRFTIHEQNRQASCRRRRPGSTGVDANLASRLGIHQRLSADARGRRTTYALNPHCSMILPTACWNSSSSTCGPQELCRGLCDLLFQAIIVMQPAKDRLGSDAVTDGKLMPMAACRNNRLDWFRGARA